MDALLRELFDAALRAADPAVRVPPFLPPAPRGRTVAVGAGKAAAAMAQAVETHWAGELSGLVVTRHGYTVPTDRIEVVEAAHPVPDDAAPRAARRMLDLVDALGPDDLVLALVSGGGSALLTLPPEGVALEDVRSVTAQLLRSGTGIGEFNLVRKHLSAITGGRLAAAAHPAQVLGLLISDVAGDDPAVIGSGPTVGESSAPADALRVLRRWGVDVPVAVAAYLESSNGCPAPDDPRLAGTRNVIVADARTSLEAAAGTAAAAGVTPVIVGDALEGEADELATRLAADVRRLRGDVPPPFVLLSGGEATVTVRGDGTGGPNAQFALALAIELDGAPGVSALACDTDGVDGAAEVAGAAIDPATLTRAVAAGQDPRAALANNDAHTFFAALADQVVTGPTMTNVNDFRAILVR